MQPAAGVFLHEVGVLAGTARVSALPPNDLPHLGSRLRNRYVLVLSILYHSGERVNWGNPRSLYNHTLLEAPLLPSLKAYILKVSERCHASSSQRWLESRLAHSFRFPPSSTLFPLHIYALFPSEKEKRKFWQ